MVMVHMLKFHLVEDGCKMLTFICFFRMGTHCGDLDKNVGIAKMLEKNILAFHVVLVAFFIINLICITVNEMCTTIN